MSGLPLDRREPGTIPIALLLFSFGCLRHRAAGRTATFASSNLRSSYLIPSYPDRPAPVVSVGSTGDTTFSKHAIYLLSQPGNTSLLFSYLKPAGVCPCPNPFSCDGQVPLRSLHEAELLSGRRSEPLRAAGQQERVGVHREHGHQRAGLVSTKYR